MLSFNGIGTKLYGKRDKNPADNSYTATKWFIFVFLPIIPIASYRVIKMPQKFLTLNFPQYQMRQIEMDWKQVGLTYLYVWGTIVAFIVILAFVS